MMEDHVYGIPHSATTSPAILARRLVFGHRMTRLLATAVALNLPDHLDPDQPQTAAELAARAQANPSALERLLRALGVIGVVHELPGRGFILTPVGAALRRNAPGGIRSWILIESAECVQTAWSRLTYATQTGRVAFNEAYGTSYYRYMMQHPEVAEIFHPAMAEATALIADAVVDVYDFQDARTIVDIGGGMGALLFRILRAAPWANGILFDVPSIVDAARASTDNAGLSSRCSVQGGDFFTSVPADGDVYLLSRVIMDYDDDAAARLLRSCREAMAPGGRVLVLQQILCPPDEECDWGANFDGLMSDICMLVLETGRERTEWQYRELFGKAGLEVRRVLSTRSAVSIIEGVKAGSLSSSSSSAQ